MVIRTPTTHLLQHFPLNGSRQGNCDNSNVARLPLGARGLGGRGGGGRLLALLHDLVRNEFRGRQGSVRVGILDCVPQ